MKSTYANSRQRTQGVGESKRENENDRDKTQTWPSLYSFDMVYYLKLNSFFAVVSNETKEATHDREKNTPPTTATAICFMFMVHIIQFAYHLSCRCVQSRFFMILSLHSARVAFIW